MENALIVFAACFAREETKLISDVYAKCTAKREHQIRFELPFAYNKKNLKLSFSKR